MRIPQQTVNREGAMMELAITRNTEKVIENVRHGTQTRAIIPANERQARPLSRLEPDKQREAWQRAVETAPDGRITASGLYGFTNPVPHTYSHNNNIQASSLFAGPSGVPAAYSNSNLNFRLQLKYFLIGKMGIVERLFLLGRLESNFWRG